MSHYRYCGKQEGIENFEDFVDKFVHEEDVFVDILEEDYSDYSCERRICIPCYRNESLRYCGKDYPQFGVYKGDQYDDVITSILNYIESGECEPSTVLVKYEDGTVIELVTVNSGEHKEVIVPNCNPSEITIYNSNEEILDVILLNPGEEVDYTCPDSHITITNSNEDIISDIDLYSNESSNFELPNTEHTVTVKDQNNNILDSETYSLYSSVDNGNSDIIVNIPDGIVEVLNSDGTIVDTVSVPYGTTVNGYAPDASVNVEYDNGTPIINTTIPSGESDTIVIPFIQNGITTMPFVTGQTIIYETNDDGDTQRGRDFFKLPVINSIQQLNYFGNKWRFTGITGGYYDMDSEEYKDSLGNALGTDGTARDNAFPDNLLLDNCTLDYDGNFLMYYLSSSYIGINNLDFSTAETYASGLTVNGFTNFFVPNQRELINTFFTWDSVWFPPMILSKNAGISTMALISCTTEPSNTSNLGGIRMDVKTIESYGKILVSPVLYRVFIRTTNISEL